MIFLLQTEFQNTLIIKEPLSDSALVNLLKGTETQRNVALKEIYKANREKVCGYIMSNSGTVDEAKDIFQEAMIAFYENVKQNSFKGESTIGTYLYSISRFKWLNQIKRNSVRTEHYKSVEKTEQLHESPMSVMIDNEKKAQVLEVLNLLGESCKKILIESIYHNASMKEIAESGNFSSEQIVRNKKYKCIKKLKELIAERPSLMKILKAYE